MKIIKHLKRRWHIKDLREEREWLAERYADAQAHRERCAHIWDRLNEVTHELMRLKA